MNESERKIPRAHEYTREEVEYIMGWRNHGSFTVLCEEGVLGHRVLNPEGQEGRQRHTRFVSHEALMDYCERYDKLHKIRARLAPEPAAPPPQAQFRLELPPEPAQARPRTAPPIRLSPRSADQFAGTLVEMFSRGFVVEEGA